MTKTISLCLIAATFAACASTTPLSTPTGKPEVTVHGKTQQAVVDHIASACAAKGYMVENQTSTMVTCSRTPDLPVQALFGTSSGSVLVKYQYAVTKVPAGVRIIVSSGWLESVNGFGGVSRQPIDVGHGSMGQKLQENLVAMTQGLE